MKTRTLNRTKYGELLAKTLPRIIHSDKELEEFTEALLELDEIEKPSREEIELAELLTTLIEQYETEQYSLRRANPVELIEFLLEQRGLSQKDLWPVIGSEGNTSEILNKKRGISVCIAAKLGEFFNVELVRQVLRSYFANAAKEAAETVSREVQPKLAAAGVDEDKAAAWYKRERRKGKHPTRVGAGANCA